MPIDKELVPLASVLYPNAVAPSAVARALVPSEVVLSAPALDAWPIAIL